MTSTPLSGAMLLPTLLLAARSFPWTASPPWEPSTTRPAYTQRTAVLSMSESDASATLVRCALRKDAPASDVLSALKEVECADVASSVGLPACASDLGGLWELVFSSAAAKLPLIDGYMPNKEELRFDLAAQRMELAIETLPLLPRMNVVGEDLSWDEQAQTLTYVVGKKPPSQWRVLFVDRDQGVIAARSSVTGLNVIHRVSE